MYFLGMGGRGRKFPHAPCGSTTDNFLVTLDQLITVKYFGDLLGPISLYPRDCFHEYSFFSKEEPIMLHCEKSANHL